MKEKQAGKTETDTEFLARLMAEGFGRVDARLDKVDTDLVEVKDRLRSLEKIQTETLGRLDSIERKQTGMLASLDETVHRSEFVRLERRVGVLEVKQA